ncbi:hypothetical protein CERSUDRAFT_115542 [Gelatoporia subvermispora B]|uniref:Secreted protein n=1 Tax=Ceriporiopsis subvermispora (strain B) TaxID=914234 RepID=M2RCI2_CERS8|nr:hypothetical protein CERSUDRAFT_115542 [Gelatoporia subvermispora B]
MRMTCRIVQLVLPWCFVFREALDDIYFLQCPVGCLSTVWTRIQPARKHSSSMLPHLHSVLAYSRRSITSWHIPSPEQRHACALRITPSHQLMEGSSRSPCCAWVCMVRKSTIISDAVFSCPVRFTWEQEQTKRELKCLCFAVSILWLHTSGNEDYALQFSTHIYEAHRGLHSTAEIADTLLLHLKYY